MPGLTISTIGSYLLQPLDVNLTYSDSSTKLLVTSDGSGRAIVVAGYVLSRGDTNSGAVNLTFVDSASNSLAGPFNIATQGDGLNQGTNFGGWFRTAPGANLELSADTACTIGGVLSWFYEGGILP